MACTAVLHPTKPNLVRVFVKGAPEYVLDLCGSYYDQDGQVQDLGRNKKEYMIHEIVKNTFAVQALRTLLIAYTDMSVQEYENLKS